MMHSAFFSFRSSQVHYSYGGDGSTLLLCFHGYGESEQSFHFLESYLPANYRMIAIDLPFHGKTQWNDGLNCTTNDMVSIVTSILAQAGNGATRFTLIGFSMGGRVALSILQAIPAQVDRLILLAPDGLKVNAWYWLATQTWMGNALFRFTMKYPGWFFFILNAMNRLGVINQSVYKFTRHYIDDETIRFQLYHRWTCMRKIRPDLLKIKILIRQYQLPVRLLYGQYDRIILPVRGEKFRKDIDMYCTLQVIPTGHQVLQEKNVQAILALL